MATIGISNPCNIKQKMLKATWDLTTYEDFVDICVKEVQDGNRPTTHFNRIGWKNVIEKFAKKTGKNYDYKQLKNKWDAMKKKWQLWNKLIGKETGLGWDPSKKTIDASDDWWNKRLEVCNIISLLMHSVFKYM
ncbi:hypothetical protein ACH5RR_041411 [Cinchona calisaya]|uniref:Myb/SANT-like domain-containing protein n=1 Tax=Cinchona calisaya TaxID=153742 RepID=A0ABD2XZD5_9GENT